MTGKSVYVTTDYREKQLQRALLQYRKPENANMVREALRLAGREDLIGNSPECLVRPAFGQGESSRYIPDKNKGGKRSRSSGGKKTVARGGTSGTRTASGRKTKLDRVFGEDSERIRREAARISDNDGKAHTAKKGGTKANGKDNGTKANAKANGTNANTKPNAKVGAGRGTSHPQYPPRGQSSSQKPSQAKERTSASAKKANTKKTKR